MKLRLVPLVLIAAFAIVLGAAACGGGDEGDSDESSMQQFFTQLERLTQHWNDERDAADRASGENIIDAGTEDEQIEILVAFVSDERRLLDELLTEIDALDAPDETSDEHAQVVVDGLALLDMYDNALIVFDTVGTFDDAVAILEGPGLTDSANAYSESCRALADLAFENEIIVDISCR